MRPEIDNEEKKWMNERMKMWNKNTYQGTHTHTFAHEMEKKWMITVCFYDNELTVDGYAAAALSSIEWQRTIKRMAENSEQTKEESEEKTQQPNIHRIIPT